VYYYGSFLVTLLEVQASIAVPSHKINRASATNSGETKVGRIQKYEVLGLWAKTIGEGKNDQMRGIIQRGKIFICFST